MIWCSKGDHLWETGQMKYLCLMDCFHWRSRWHTHGGGGGCGSGPPLLKIAGPRDFQKCNEISTSSRRGGGRA